MIEILDYSGNDFKTLVEFEGWKVAYLRYSERFSKLEGLERHHITDEVFVLLCGEATIYTKNNDEEINEYKMENGKLYNVKKDVWHHITVSKDATVLVVENSNTNKENTEKVKTN